ncbi:hypothetical protein AB0D08_36060 [Kitasatospora sp. NPDC048540]|uniref:hypothetical protein n=1 Tax=unclassified Kitasatospora TaxID=2633591 RepID=UPI00053B00DB|nr:hypothetical protein [Kitasatospora sp. MBT63]
MTATRALRTAAYLRCYPYDSWRMAPHVRALEEHAGLLGLDTPRLFLDNGVSCRSVQPQLRVLLALASLEAVDTVLVPGRWVFSLDQGTADAVAGFLVAAGTRVVELPAHRRTARAPQPSAARS